MTQQRKKKGKHLIDIELTVAERLGLLVLLPREGNLTTLRIVQRMRLDLSFDENEHKMLQFQESENQLTWNPNIECVKAISFGAKAMQVIQEILTAMSDAGNLRIEHLSLCDKFGIES